MGYLKLDMYSDAERNLSAYMSSTWGHFAHGNVTIPKTHMGEAFVITEKTPHMMEKVNTKRCHFLSCIPSLAEHSKTGMMENKECEEFVMSGAEKIKISILTMLTMVTIFLNKFTF